MKALVVYAYTNYAEDGKIEVSSDWGYFCGDNPMVSEILDFEEGHSKYPNRCNVKIINIIKVNE